MSMTLMIPTDIAAAARDEAARTGAAPENIILEVLRAHFPPVPEALRAEFDAFERASNEDFVRFEESLGAA